MFSMTNDCIIFQVFLTTPEQSSVILPGAEVRQKGLYLPRFSFLSFLKICTRSASFQSSGTSSGCLAVTSNQVLEYPGVNPNVPHIIIEKLWLEGTLKIIELQPNPDMVRVALPRAPSYLTRYAFREGSSTTFLGNKFQRITTE